MATLDNGLQKITDLTKQLISYFCENENSFKMEECISSMHTFCDRVKQCQKVLKTVKKNISLELYFHLILLQNSFFVQQENIQRKQQEEKAERRKKQQQEMAQKRANSM